MSISGVIDRKAMADRDAHYKLAGLVEMDDPISAEASLPNEEEALAGKATVIVLVEDRGRKAGFAKMHKVEKMSSDNIRPIAAEGFVEGTVALVHTLLANIKGNIRGVYKGAHHKHLQRYLDEFR